jgi:SAM-dependent methyltransferase
MTEPSWADGYVVDLGYTHGYYRELAPSTLRFVTLLGGLQTPDADGSFTYYELGCGNGHSLTLHAAANPNGRFIGADFNPTHVHNARKFAQECGVENAQFLEKSFAELAAADMADAEFVALHGVHSWVSHENRRQIVEFIRRRLKPGGVAYLSYNCLPGLGPVQPLQRLLHEHAKRASDGLTERIGRAIQFASRLNEAGAEFFRMNPVAQARLARLGSQDARYLAHEYFNAHWSPSYHVDVAQEMSDAKLGYAGSAEFLANFDQFVLKPEVAQVIAQIADRPFAETLKDFARNQVFRRDVFTRGAPPAGARDLSALLGRARFALSRPRVGCRLQLATPAAEVTLQTDAYAPVLDALARAPMTFDELSHAPECAQLDNTRLRQAVFGMAAFGNVLPALPAGGEHARRASTRRYNTAVLSRPMADTGNTMLASPVLGAGIAVSFVDRLFLAALPDQRGMVESALRTITFTGRRLLGKDGQPLTDSELSAMLEGRAQSFSETLLPFLRQLGVGD